MAFNLSDLFSGGQDSAAQQTLKDQLGKLNALPTPTAAQSDAPAAPGSMCRRGS